MNDSNIAIDGSTCLACGRCVDRCIMDNLRLVLPPCRQASPLGINYQGILRLTARGDFAGAACELRRCTPFGGLLAALGDNAASRACSRGSRGGALNLAAILEFLARTQESLVYKPTHKLPRSCKRAVVMGTGFPALQAACTLRMGGHAVTVQNFSLPPDTDVPSAVTAKTLTMLKSMGIAFETGPAHTDWTTVSRAYDVTVLTFCPAALTPDALGQAGETLFALAPKGRQDLLQDMASAERMAHAARNLLEGFSTNYESDERTARGLERFHGLSDEQENMPECAPVYCPESGFFEAEARAEASRCLGCGRPVERNMTCWYCLPCEVVCPTQSLHVRIPYLIR